VYCIRGLKCGKILFTTEYIRVVLRSEVEKGVTSAIPRVFFVVIGLYFVAPRVVYASRLMFLSSSVYWCFVNQRVI
jgi:hypothetical protein